MSERSERVESHSTWQHKTHSVAYVLGLFTLSDHSLIVAHPPASFLCCPRQPSHRPSSLPSVFPVPAVHLLPLATPFWPYPTHGHAVQVPFVQAINNCVMTFNTNLSIYGSRKITMQFILMLSTAMEGYERNIKNPCLQNIIFSVVITYPQFSID